MKVIKLDQPLETGETHALIVSDDEGAILRALLGKCSAKHAPFTTPMWDEVKDVFDQAYKVSEPTLTIRMEKL